VISDGEVLLPEKQITIVTNDYIIGHAQDKYFGFPVHEYKDTELSLEQALLDWFHDHKVLEYTFEDRIVEIEK
jgi:hypothetical protein